MKKKLLSVLKFLLFLAIGVGLLYYLFTQQDADLNTTWQDIKGANYAWIGVALILYLLSNVSRSIRWQMLLKAMGYKTKFANALAATMIGYFFNSVIPRSGEVARPGLLSRYERIPLEKVLGTIVVDRSFDILSLAAVFGIALLFESERLLGFLSQNAQLPSFDSPVILLGGGLFLVLLVLIFIFRKKLLELKIFKILLEKIKGFLEGILAIRKVERPFWFIFHSISIWVFYYLMTYIAFWSFEPTAHLGPEAGLLTFVFGTLGILIPAPGGMGSYQFLVSTCLENFYDIARNSAFSFSNIAFWPIYFFNIVVGCIAFISLPLINRKNDESSLERSE